MLGGSLQIFLLMNNVHLSEEKKISLMVHEVCFSALSLCNEVCCCSDRYVCFLSQISS
jgi:hypothetical protein